MIVDKMSMESVIVCYDDHYGIGLNGTIPWKSSADLKRFSALTTLFDNSALIMGYGTWMSLPKKPLKNRLNVVITRSHSTEVILPAMSFSSISDALKYCREKNCCIYIIGGQSILEEYLKNNVPQHLYLTYIHGNWNCDRVFPNDLVNYRLYDKETTSCSENGINLDFFTYRLAGNVEECNYLSLMRKVLAEGQHTTDRTGIGTYSVFAPSLKFNLTDYQMPVLTTKKVAFKTLAKELLWFISGSTDTKILEQQNVFIWKENTTESFLKSRNLPYDEGDMGPGYGFQWRHAGAEYTNMHADYTGQGTDQLKELINTIQTDPHSRRILMSSWNVQNLKMMALPPCHILYQVYCNSERGTLSAQMYQRSADSFLGVPFNIASYALLTHIIAEICGLKAEQLTLVFGDYHIYNNHIDQVKEQLLRRPYRFPQLKFTRDLKNVPIESVNLSDFELINYTSHPPIKADMAV